MMKQFEVIRKRGGEWVAHIYEVQYDEGRCDDPGDYPHRPKHYEPAGVVYVFDEDGNDVTAWALAVIGENTLLNKDYIEIKRKRVKKPAYRWTTAETA